MQFFTSINKLGILGGGQLGKMLLYNTRKFDVYTCVLDPSDDAPSKLACNEFYKGDLMDFETVYNFGKKVNILTIEIENVNTKALKNLEEEGIKVYPSSETLEIIQNKAKQKSFYKKNNLPTAPFKKYLDKIELENAILMGREKIPFVWKSAKFGYDGNGVKIIRSKSDTRELPNVECIAEEYIPFNKEISVIVARNLKGETSTYPVVEMEFHSEANQVEYVICPARIPKSIAEKATSLAINVSQKFNHIGLLAVEMFVTNDKDILINEVAPRPHNSGHQTIEANYTSQFEQHLRAILNLPLGSTENKLCSVMVNLVGSEGHNGPVIYENIEKILSFDGVTPHIYGKKNTRPFRKMGHVTIVNSSIEKAKTIAKKIKESVKIISK